MKETIDQALSDLSMKRELIKKELLEKQAQQANAHHRYIAFGESVSLEQRLALQAEIAALESDRQSTKVRLLEMKQQAKDVRMRGFKSAIEEKLKAIGMGHLIDEALAEAHEEMLKQGMGDAYKLSL
jgi:hypothetical protein